MEELSRLAQILLPYRHLLMIGFAIILIVIAVTIIKAIFRNSKGVLNISIKLFEHQARALDSTAEHNRVAYYLDMG